MLRSVEISISSQILQDHPKNGRNMELYRNLFQQINNA